MILTVLLLGHALHFQGDAGLDKKISFTCPATPIEVVAEQLSSQCGVPLSTVAPLSDEMLILRLKDVPVRVAMEKIAAAAVGEWEAVDGGYRLIRPATLVHSFEHQETLKRVAAIRKAIDQRVKDFGKFDAGLVRTYFDKMQNMSDSGDGSAVIRYEKTGAGTKEDSGPTVQEPAERLGTRLLAGISPEALADLPSGERVVFSTRPTQMQRTLDGSMFQAVSDFVREQSIWDKAAKAQQMSAGREVDDSNPQVNDYTSMSRWGPQGTVDKPVARILAIMNPDWESYSLEVRFKLCDASGRVMSAPGISLSLFDRDRWGVSTSGADDAAPPKPAKPLNLSPLAEELQSYFRQGDGGQLETGDDFVPPTPVLKPPSSALREFVMNPETSEPLVLFPSEPILKEADSKDLNVAVCVDDSSFDSTLNIWSGGYLPSQCLGETVKAEKGWLTGYSGNPLHPQHESRKALARFMQGCAKTGRIDVDSLSGYAQGVPSFESSLGYPLCIPIFPNRLNQPDSPNDWMYLRLFGSLNASQREVLGKGSKLSLSTMTSNQIKTVATIVYRNEIENDGMVPDDSESEAPTEEQVRAQMLRAMQMEMGTLRNEPTELLPSGVDLGISITMSHEEDEVIFAAISMNGRPMPARPMEVDNLAMMLYSSEHGGFFGGDENWQMKVDGCQPGHRTTFTLTLNLPQKCSDSGTISDAVMNPGGMTGIDKLPEETKKKIQDRLAQLKKAFKDNQISFGRRSGGGGDNGVPPP